jgi:hypothetical protein
MMSLPLGGGLQLHTETNRKRLEIAAAQDRSIEERRVALAPDMVTSRRNTEWEVRGRGQFGSQPESPAGMGWAGAACEGDNVLGRQRFHSLWALSTPCGETPIDLGEALRQLCDLPKDGIALWTEHPGQVVRALAIDREAEEMDAL